MSTGARALPEMSQIRNGRYFKAVSSEQLIAFGRPTFAAPARPDAYALHRKGEGRGG